MANSLTYLRTSQQKTSKMQSKLMLSVWLAGFWLARPGFIKSHHASHHHSQSALINVVIIAVCMDLSATTVRACICMTTSMYIMSG